jgi:AbrB family looped-hinge helix DNA binding protein
MNVKLSSKGQLVIPKRVRKALGLTPGTRLRVHVADGRIVLEPIVLSPIDRLYGQMDDVDLLAEHEQEHRREIAADAASLRT